MNFQKIYKNTPDEIKLIFLAENIKTKPGLQASFIEFINSADANNQSVIDLQDFSNLVNEARKKYMRAFEKIDLENPDWDNYIPSHTGYIEDWEEHQEATKQEVDTIFDRFKEESTQLIRQQSYGNLLALAIGIIFAFEDLEIDDPYGDFEDVNEMFLDSFHTALTDVIEIIDQSVIPGNHNAVIELFLSYYNQRQPAEPNIMSYLEPLLIIISEKSTQPAQLLESIIASNINKAHVPQLVLLLNKNSGKHTEWLKSAESYYKTNIEIAKQLIDYYFEKDQDKYLQHAHELFETDKIIWAEYLQNSISYKLDKQLYIKVYSELCTCHHDISCYKKINAILSPAQKEQLLDQISWNARLTVEILTIEKRYGEIKEVVNKNMNSRDFVHLLSPIIEIYPEFCFDAIKQQVTNTLKTERGRSVYERIVKKIQLAKNIPGFASQTNELIMQLYNHKPNLPALKGEFRIGGLV